MARKKKRGNNKWWVLALVFVLIGLLFFLIPSEDPGNIALIKIHGVITAEGASGMFSSSLSSYEVVNLIENAQKKENIDAVLLEINSPGGSPVASEEIVKSIKRLDKPVVSYIRDSGASGGYWVASATDRIFSSPLSIVGSIGVTGSYLEFAKFIEDHNVTYREMTSGKYKEIGSPLDELEKNEKERLQRKLDLMHSYFLKDVKKNRNLSSSQVGEVNESDFYVGMQGKKLGLVDEFGGKKKALEYIKKEYNITPDTQKFEVQRGFFEKLSRMMAKQSYYLGRGMGGNLLDNKIMME